MARGQQLAAAARQVVAEYEAAIVRVRAHTEALREQAVVQALEAITVARLRDVTEGRLRVAALEAAGYATVGRVHAAQVYDLVRVPGIGRATAEQAKAAAGQLARATREATAVRIDPDERGPEATALLTALFPLVQAGSSLRAARRRAEETCGELELLLDQARAAGSWWRMVVAGRAGRETAVTALARIEDLLLAAERDGARESFAQAVTDLLRMPVSPDHAWLEFATRSVEFYTELGLLVETGPADDASAEGHLPDDLAAQVRVQSLDTAGLKVSLRGYQEFGARYALARRRVILGDEMGLGKTVQAIAALVHLAAASASHFAVVCPASVLVNWLREIEARCHLPTHRVHGPDRALAHEAWRHRGGIAVTTFEGLRHLDTGTVPLSMLVVDEAHYVKNPDAQRSKQVAEVANRCERVLFLTGTPMENRVGEFRNLLTYLQPDLLAELRDVDALVGAPAFRRAIAPAYLRRNQKDVLTELPRVVSTDDWQEFSESDADAYRNAVLTGNFQAMRRAAYAHPAGSAKLRRLREIVAEATESGEKVLVFSFYRDVLASVHASLADTGPALFGPVSGGMSTGARQDSVDGFTDHQGAAVLLAQIQAGGVGLNLQAANVVVLCEPQIKPALEQQAIARAHRMGQTRRVRVHRLLTPDSVDQHLVTLLGRKERLFDAYARRSEAAESSPEALDISDAALARQIIEEEQLRLAGAIRG